MNQRLWISTLTKNLNLTYNQYMYMLLDASEGHIFNYNLKIKDILFEEN